jgi:glycosyltransferase involved in cell wall biosynthesis
MSGNNKMKYTLEYFLKKIGLLPKQFDGLTYQKMHPDLAKSNINPMMHFIRYGRREVRSFLLPNFNWLIEGKLNEDQETVLIVSHEASRTGAPILSLNLAQAFIGKYNVVVLLLGDGPLCSFFVSTGATVAAAFSLKGNALLVDVLVGKLCKEYGFKFALINSIESRDVLPALSQHFVPTITLIHEFASYTRPRDAIRSALFWSNEVVFSTQITLENALTEYPDLSGDGIHVLPQGKCVLPLLSVPKKEVDFEQERIWRLMRPANADSDTFIILGAGFVQYRKGVDLFIECANRVIKAPGGHKCRFIWIGKGYNPELDVGYSVYLADQIHRSGLKNHILFLDETNSIETAYAEADILLVPSRLDPLPNVAIDAMMCGLPVLCFEKTTGIADFLINAGLEEYCIAQYLDPSDMAKKVIALLGSPEKRKLVSKKSLNQALEFYSMEKYVSGLEEIAESAEYKITQQIKNLQNIKKTSVFRSDFASPNGHSLQDIDMEISFYLAGWSSGVSPRKPFPGFHPGIYKQQRGDDKSSVDPLVDYIDAGEPEGVWRNPVVEVGTIPTTNLPKNETVALHVHVYYADLLAEIIERINSNFIRPDLYITFVDKKNRAHIMDVLSSYEGRIVDVALIPNRGRDLGPFLSLYVDALADKYEYVGHLHTKKSVDVIDSNTGKQWRNFLLENLLGSKTTGSMADSILYAMKTDESIGIVFPDDPNIIGWTSNREYAQVLAYKMGIKELPSDFNFPVGSMFWARSAALFSWVDLSLSINDYPEEPLPYDGTILHAIERLLTISVNSKGFRYATTNIYGLTR